MSMRVHVIKKQVIEYGDAETFNYSHDTFQSCLETLDCDVNPISSTDEYYPAEFEVEKAQYKEAIKTLETAVKKHKNNPDSENEYYNSIMSDLRGYRENGEQVTPEWLLGVMKLFLKESERKSDYIRFSVF